MKGEWRMINDEGRMTKDEWWMMKDDDFKLLRGFADERTDGRTDERTDICDCRVAFATENIQRKWIEELDLTLGIQT